MQSMTVSHRLCATWAVVVLGLMTTSGCIETKDDSGADSGATLGGSGDGSGSGRDRSGRMQKDHPEVRRIIRKLGRIIRKLKEGVCSKNIGK